MNICLYNGDKVSNREIISVYNGSFLYGINCFEGLRGYWDDETHQLRLSDLNRHIDRLFDSASRLSFNFDLTKERLKTLLHTLIIEENIRQDVYVRITLFIDGETSWMEQQNISHLISVRAMTSCLFDEYATRNYSLHVSSFLRNSENSTPPSIKAGANYLNSRYAKLDAIENGFDDALIVNSNGFISESTGSCIFFIKDGGLITPSLECDILPSITRHRIIALCKMNDIEITESQIKTDIISDIDGAFLCGSMIEIMPVSQIDNHLINTNELELFHRVFELLKDSIKIENI